MIPEVSRRIARAVQTLTPEERLEVMRGAVRVETFEELPEWIRVLVLNFEEAHVNKSKTLTLTLKHLPSRHDQSTHGRGWNGGRGRRRDGRGRFSRGAAGEAALPATPSSAPPARGMVSRFVLAPGDARITKPPQKVARRAKYMLMSFSHSTGTERPRQEHSKMTISVKRKPFRESDVTRDGDGRFSDIPGRGNDAPARGTTARLAVRADDARRTGKQTRSNFVHPVTGHAMGKTETGDTYEALFEAKGAPLLEERFGGTYEAVAVTGGWLSRNTPLDFKVGEYGGELKSLSVTSTNQKTAIKKEEIERKEKAVADAGLKPLLVVQVVDQKSGSVQVYALEAFASKAVTRMEHVGGYDYTLTDFEDAQRKTGHHDKREARAAAEAG